MGQPQEKTEVEAELKIRLSRHDLEEVFKTLSKKAAVISHKYLPRAYYDTADLDLYKAGRSLRVQYKPGKDGKLGGYEQTVKVELPPANDAAAAVLFRRECKNILEGHLPDISSVKDAEAQKALKPFKDKKLVHIFTAAIERRYFEIDVAKAGTVEVAFDVGKIILPSNNLYQDLFEIEIEIKHGSVGIIDVVKQEILSMAPSAEVQPHSKAVQGAQFYQKYGR